MRCKNKRERRLGEWKFDDHLKLESSRGHWNVNETKRRVKGKNGRWVKVCG